MAAAPSTCRRAPTRSSSRPTGSPRPSTAGSTSWSARATASTPTRRSSAARSSRAARTPASRSRCAPAVRRSAIQPVSVQQYADDSIDLGYANTEGQVLRWDETPVISVVAPLEINPQIIYWDPETYPDVETLADLGERGRDDQRLPRRHVRRRLRRPGHLERGPGRRVLRRQPVAVHRRGRRDRPAGLRLRRAVQVRARVHRVGQADRLPDVPRRRVRGVLADPLDAPGQARGADPVPGGVRARRPAGGRSTTSPTRRGRTTSSSTPSTQYDTFWTYGLEFADFSVADPEGARPRRQRPRRHARQHGRGADPDRDRRHPRRRPDDVPADLVAADLFTNEFIDESIGMP